MKISNELKTGALVLTAAAVLMAVLYKTGDLSYGKKGYTIVTRLNFAGGVKKYAPVRLSGLEVGEVRKLQMIYNPGETLIEAHLWIEEGYKLRRDSKAIVGTMGLMGEKYIEVTAGSAPEFIVPGDMIESEDPVSMDELMRTFNNVGEDVQLTLGDFRELIRNANGVIGENRQKIGRIVDNLEEASAYATDFTLNIKHHPWKVLQKGKDKSPEEMASFRSEWRKNKLDREAAGESAEVDVEEAISDSEAKNQETTETRTKPRSVFGSRR
jgi:phospholipid/cholesterol/gamma-HCH transport system substrate-binding protein